jgi:hypothetical protein
LYQQLLRLAHQVPALRRYLVPLLRTGAKQGPPARWDEFLKERYEGGKKKVRNPNLKTKDKYPEVSLYTALKDPHMMKRVLEEYHRWAGKDKTRQPKKLEEGTVIKTTKGLTGIDATSSPLDIATGTELVYHGKDPLGQYASQLFTLPNKLLVWIPTEQVAEYFKR